MGRWRMRLFTVFFSFGLGFLTAVYTLSPAPAVSDGQTRGVASANAAEQSRAGGNADAVAKLRVGLDKALSFAEDNAKRLGQVIKDQISPQAASGSKSR